MIPTEPGYYWAFLVPFEMGDPRSVVYIYRDYNPHNLSVNIIGSDKTFKLEDFTGWEGPIK